MELAEKLGTSFGRYLGYILIVAIIVLPIIVMLILGRKAYRMYQESKQEEEAMKNRNYRSENRDDNEAE